MQNKELLLKKLRLENDASDETIKVACEKLKYTYELVATSSTDPDIKQIAENKLRELRQLSDSVIANVKITVSHDDSYGETVAAARKLLENARASEEALRAMIVQLSNTAITSENYYLQTLLYLQINCGYPGCVNAKKTIENAIAIEPNNEAYLAIKRGIDSVIQAKIDFDAEQLRIAEEKMREEEQKRRELEQEAIKQQRKAICGSIFECVCGCVGMIFACICGCCEDC